MRARSAFRPILFCLGLCFASCAPAPQEYQRVTSTAAVVPQIPSPTQVLPSAVPQPTAPLIATGPDADGFPDGFNPLTGLPVAKPDLLDLPALLVSIPHFPPQARPQAGLSFAPWVFEYLISAGSTRLLGVFYGRYPAPEIPVVGDCVARAGPIVPAHTLLGNRVWLDADRDGIQDPEEPGIEGVCVSLLDAVTGEILAHTTTDSNGFYGFDAETGRSYLVEFEPGRLEFTGPDVGDESHDSDASALTGRAGALPVLGDDRSWDAGLLPPPSSPISSLSEGPTAQVGPVRSARLVNIHIHDFFQDSCLIYAGSTREIRDRIPHCAEVFKEGDGGVGAMLDISRMKTLAEKNGINQGSNFNYSGNLFAESIPAGGQAVTRLDVYVADLNQSAWVYDSSGQSWLRYVDDADDKHIGVLHPDTDRLTGRQLYFENLLVLYAEHEVLAPAIIDMYLQQGETGNAILLRDGQIFRLKWSTRAGEYEQRTGFRRPIAFVDESGNPFPLHPGRTWLIIATPFSRLGAGADGGLRLRIVPPPGAGVY